MSSPLTEMSSENIFGSTGNTLDKGISKIGGRIPPSSEQLIDITDTIMQNAVEITGVPLGWLENALEVSLVHINGLGIRQKGRKAVHSGFAIIAHSLSLPLGETSSIVKYATTLYLLNAIAQKHQALTASVADIDNRTFASEEGKEAARERETSERDLTGRHLPEMTQGLEKFGQAQWGDDASTYAEIIHVLIAKTKNDFTNARRRVTKDHVLEALKEGQLHEAKRLIDIVFPNSNP